MRLLLSKKHQHIRTDPSDWSQGTRQHCDINFAHLYAADAASKAGEKCPLKERIEFRGQVATFDPEEANICAKSWVGLFCFIGRIRGINPADLEATAFVIRNETGEKFGNGIDEERGQANGPSPADGPCTIIHVLQELELYVQGLFYRHRWHPRAQISPTTKERYRGINREL